MREDNEDLGEFPTYLEWGDYGEGPKPKCLLELRIQELSTALRCKPEWWRKMNDEDIRNRWMNEAVEQGLSNEAFEIVMQQLRFLGGLSEGDVRVSSVDGVYESDERIPVELRDKLREAVKVFEEVPDDKKDWHPGSDQLVLDLVHPSLFCLVNGVSRVIPEDQKDKSWKDLIGSGQPISDDDFEIAVSRDIPRFASSNKFQWLPSDVIVDEAGGVKFDSYVNNIHPQDNSDLIQTLEEILSRFIPLFNKVLTHMKDPWPNMIEVDEDWYPEFSPNPDLTEEAEEDEWDEYYRTREPIQPSLPLFFPTPQVFDDIVDLRGSRLQVITKIANIILTPDDPTYPGGSWHVEGMGNENIVASGIYYYQSENISESRLNFRQIVSEPDYEQSDDRGVNEIYGMVNDGPLNQPMGHSICRENRCLCFPNTLQHQVSPFELADKTKGGVRKILVFFLVDPTIHVWSTKRVPPQQLEWYRKESSMTLPIPESVQEMIEDHLDFPLSMDQAKKYREELMEERKYFVSAQNDEIFERPFSLCEH